MSTNGNWTQKSILHGLMKTLKNCAAFLEDCKHPFKKTSYSIIRFMICKNSRIKFCYLVVILKIKCLKYQSSLLYLVRYVVNIKSRALTKH